MTERFSCWSITINNPTKAELLCQVPGWKLTGQFEKGKEGTEHFQGMLKTPQVRFSAVKRAFPRAHIEGARNALALAAYVSKEDTRVATYEANSVPSLFQYQDIIAKLWDVEQFDNIVDAFHITNRNPNRDDSDAALGYVDILCAREIEKGARGLEFVAINPMWRSSWKRFYRSIIKRNASSSPPEEARLPAEIQEDRPDGTESEQPNAETVSLQV